MRTLAKGIRHAILPNGEISDDASPQLKRIRQSLGRTRDEIGRWTLYPDGERRAIMSALPARLDTVERKPRRETRRSRMVRERGQA